MGGERDGGSAKNEQLRVNEADRRCVKSPELVLVVAPARCSPGRQGGREGEREWEGRDATYTYLCACTSRTFILFLLLDKNDC
jgi:hypothetical protein